VTSDEQVHATMRLLRDFGRTEGGSDRYLRVGWNLKFTDLQAVIGIEQLRRLPVLIEQKRQLFAWYGELLDGVPEVLLPRTDLTQVTPWFVDVLVEADIRDTLAQHLRRAGIGTRPCYPALHAEPAFRMSGSFPVAEEVSARMLWLPSSLRLGRDDVARVCDTIRTFYRS
jgi:perosamine synthetase